MDLKQARRLYKTYKRHPNNTLDIKTFLTICETYEYYLKEVRNLVSDRQKQIEKLKKENKEKNDLVNEIIKRIPLEGGNGNHATNKDNLLENLDIFIDEWERLENKEDEEIEFASINWVRRSEYEKLQKENEKLKKDVEFYKEIAMKGGQ